MNLQRRITYLEKLVAPKPGPRHVVFTNVADPESGYTLELLPGLYLDVIGKPLSEQKVEELRERYRQENATVFGPALSGEEVAALKDEYTE
jgi:hypothetical protein